MKQAEVLRWLRSQGVRVEEGGSHLKLYFSGRQTVLSRHPSKEIPNLHLRTICKQLGLPHPMR